jgi:hypothetical protein
LRQNIEITAEEQSDICLAAPQLPATPDWFELELMSRGGKPLNGTQINSDTLIFADQAKPNLALGVICVNPAFSALICVPLPLTHQDPKT